VPRRSWAVLLGCLVAGFLLLSPVMLVGEDLFRSDPPLTAARKQCEARLRSLRSSAEFWRWFAIFAAGLGGGVAAASGIAAGRTEGRNEKVLGITGKVWGFVALLSGGLAATTSITPKPDTYISSLASVDRHYIVGFKVERQIPSVVARSVSTVEEQNKQILVAYSLARYTECLSQTPSEVPDIPDLSDLPKRIPGVEAKAPTPKNAAPRDTPGD
jgi:hypothetical protein